MEKDKKKTVFVHQPEYPGGPKEMSKFIQEHLRYPEKALAAAVEGTVIVEFDIDHKGKVVGTRVLQGVGHGCDEEACRVVKMLQFDVPKNRGMRVLFHKKTHIHFRKPVQKPAPLPVSPQAGFQITYSYQPTPTTSQEEPPKQAPSGETYTYTISL